MKILFYKNIVYIDYYKISHFVKDVKISKWYDKIIDSKFFTEFFYRALKIYLYL